MSNATLCLHRGSRIVERSEVEYAEPVQGTDTWFPTSHIDVLMTAETTLRNAGFQISRTQLALSADNREFFGTLDLTTSIVDGVTMVAGVRNSVSKKFPMGLAAGSRVFVCDNLAFNSEIYVSKKHTRWGHYRFNEGISRSMQALGRYQVIEAKRIEQYRETTLTESDASKILLDSYEAGVLSSITLPVAIKEWREPSHMEFCPRTAWSAFNAITKSLKVRQSNPQKFSAITMKLYGLIDKTVGFNSAV